MQHDTKSKGATGVNCAPSAPPTFAVLTVDEVAHRLQVSKAGVYELTRFRQTADTPRLPARKIGRSLRFIASEIDSWVLSLPKHTHLQRRHYIRKNAA